MLNLGLLMAQSSTVASTAVLLGIAYGVFWWVVGALVLMPMLLGGGPQLNRAFELPSLLSLMGHVVFGVATSATIVVMTRYRNAFD